MTIEKNKRMKKIKKCLFRGLIHRGRLDNNPDLMKFGETVERVCVETVESGIMTKDLAGCVHGGFSGLTLGKDYVITDEFMQALDDNLQKAMKA